MKADICKFFIFSCILSAVNIYAQQQVEKYTIDSLTLLHKRILIKNDFINFLEITKDPESGRKKDLIFFLQGSDPSPLISEDDNGKFLLLPFDIKQLSRENIFVIISKPKIPVYQHFKDLDDNFKVDDPKILTSYFKYNTLEHLSDEVNLLTKIYAKDKRIRNIYVIGYSQGGRVALHISHKKIRKIAVLSVNLFGRYEESINRMRYEEISRQDSTLEKKIEQEYISYNQLIRRSLFSNTLDDLSLRSYKTFTIPGSFTALEKIRIPILIAYGSNDIGVAFSNDTIRFRLTDKKNINFKVYPLLSHNFEKLITVNNENENHWQQVFEETLTWLKK
ncbi:esterase/lipase [Chryseobacterium sp. SORGH_AS 447]|uniref:hypothetical protein n=1 Tax=Chryseobacterium sp. SORGH_AS_0447 TaxID=3041769 RepID=UPI0027847410|nr:hypothetical protein [Chryseobacterium sp. SORGH_AS_0447]MDQ1160749.1 esterase/lipase [Chryseobacterium sp. SORGH_AS_0447]